MNTNFNPIKPEQITENPFVLLNDDWMLITAGTPDKFNTMTASWGGMGVLWNKRVVYIFIRPPRYTYDFVENSSIFTLSFFNNDYRKALRICGETSGRDTDKIKATGLTPLFSNDYIAFEEAKLIFQCRKIYFNDILSENFLDPKIQPHYPNNDYHRMYVGEIEQVLTKKMAEK
ncbi:MAG: flavin reductase [Bacteroidota bacterium]